ncbi:uncharacterized protein LOC128721164 [Anopheles nili]|uniref:uncharacterized protein LOC128721164 n=1 Tax=Anopheles nili TaxID=185578 RepID=UPI00237A0E61|nr:uncharacterized protein LOC128721164 [Anopheles nili]
MCNEYKKLTTDSVAVSALTLNPTLVKIDVPKCDMVVKLIVGGNVTKPGEFPHMAAIGWRLPTGGYSFDCGGSLISDQYVLTAAHCYIEADDGVLPSIVRLGDQSLVRQDDGAEPQDYQILRFIVHPEFKWREGKYNDLAVIQLRDRVRFTNFIRPACLYDTDVLSTPTVIATGFGLMEDFGTKSDELRKVSLYIYGNDLCAERYRLNRHMRQGIRNSQMCVGNLAGGKDTCQGDSGGPLQITREENQCMFYIVGVTSFGQVCGSATPAIYTKVSSYLNWIESVVWPHEQTRDERFTNVAVFANSRADVYTFESFFSLTYGEPCVFDSGPGICRSYSVCQRVLETTRVVNICDYAPHAIVCCPVDYEQRLQQLDDPNKRISVRKCQEYNRPGSSAMQLGHLAVGSSLVKVKPSNRCPTDQNLIVGGTPARYGEFPHMARLAVVNANGQYTFVCGATLISEQWVMTAAHCLESPTLAVRLGEVKEGNPDYGEPIDVRVQHIVAHPNYKGKTVYNDIALLKLANPVTFSSRVRPACLYSEEDFARTKAVAIGFGSKQIYEENSKELLRVSLDVFSTAGCASYFPPRGRVPQGIQSTQLCAGFLQGGRDTCTGDSGGPLQIYSNDGNCRAQIIGVTSFGVSCGSSTPGIYTRVSEYIDWIESTVWPKSG